VKDMTARRFMKDTRTMGRRLAHSFGVLAIGSLGLTGCTAIQSGEVFQSDFWAGSPLRENDEAELGIAELTKGNFVAAEGHFQRALRVNPKDVDALIGAGILYQNTGQLTKAREMYEAVLALRPDESRQFIVLNNLQTQPASKLASVNLSLIDTGGVTSSLQLGRAGTDPVTGQAAGGINSAPQSAALLGRASGATVPTQPGGFLPGANIPGQQEVQPLGLSGAPQVNEGSLSRFTQAERNKISRFATIRALRDQGLITQQEYLARRQTNVGALLPLTSPQPAAGLDRPVPTTDQISNRLRAIGRALEQRAISVSQHASERSLILTALLPEAPVRLAPPAVPPRGLIKAADSVAKLEQLRDGGFITSDEYARERQAIEVGHINYSPALQGDPRATEAMFLMMRRVFDELGYRRYEWKCNALNEASRNAALRLGFQFEGVFRQAMISKGRNRDTAWFGMTDGDWALLKPAYEAWLAPENFGPSGQQKKRLSDLTRDALGL